MQIPSLKNTVSADEWQLRCDLAACYRLVALHGWTDLIFTCISARMPGPDHRFLINPYGLMFDEITASSLIMVDTEGNRLSNSEFEVNRAGFVIHSAIHSAREDVQCVLHTHTRAGVAVSAQKGGLLPISQQSTFVLDSLGYHDYEGVALRDEEKPRLQEDIGSANYLMLRNHGLLTVGKTVADAFLHMYLFETSCQIQLSAQTGGDLMLVDREILAGAASAAHAQTGGTGGSFVWPALIRKLDRIDDSYRSKAKRSWTDTTYRFEKGADLPFLISPPCSQMCVGTARHDTKYRRMEIQGKVLYPPRPEYLLARRGPGGCADSTFDPRLSHGLVGLGARLGGPAQAL
jgi:ribulose-5-phosphate 4-epimerase/fuculose-1-phosphate aldolase